MYHQWNVSAGQAGTTEIRRSWTARSCAPSLLSLSALSQQSVSSAFLLIQFLKLCPSLLPLSAHHSLPSSPVPLYSRQPFPPIYSHCVSTSRAACICSEDWCPCVQQPALLHTQTPRLTLLLHRHLASEGSPAQHCCSETDMMEAAQWAAVSKLLPSIFTCP